MQEKKEKKKRRKRRKKKNGEVRILSPSSISISSSLSKKSDLEKEREIIKGLQNPENPTALLDSRQFEFEAILDSIQESNRKFGYEEPYKAFCRAQILKKKREENGEFDEGYILSSRIERMLFSKYI